MKSWLGAVGMTALLAATAAGQGVEPGSVAASDQLESGAGTEAKTRARAALLQACQAEADRLCAEALGAGGDKPLVGCLVEYKEQLEPACIGALKRARRVQAFRRRCGSDVKKLCPGVEPGEGRIVACLKENRAQVSKACRDRWARRRAKKKPEDVASVADEAIAEELAGAEPIEEELAPLDETPAGSATGDGAEAAGPDGSTRIDG